MVLLPLPGCSGKGWAPPQLGPTEFSGWEWGRSFVSQQNTGNGAIDGEGAKNDPKPQSVAQDSSTWSWCWPSAGYSFLSQWVLLSLLLSLSAGGYLLVKCSDLIWLLPIPWVILPGWGALLGNQGWDPWEWACSAPECPPHSLLF